MKPRWHVVITYTSRAIPDTHLHIEELSMLHDEVEYGPDWRTILAIGIELTANQEAREAEFGPDQRRH